MLGVAAIKELLGEPRQLTVPHDFVAKITRQGFFDGEAAEAAEHSFDKHVLGIGKRDGIPDIPRSGLNPRNKEELEQIVKDILHRAKDDRTKVDGAKIYVFDDATGIIVIINKGLGANTVFHPDTGFDYWLGQVPKGPVGGGGS